MIINGGLTQTVRIKYIKAENEYFVDRDRIISYVIKQNKNLALKQWIVQALSMYTKLTSM